MRRRTFRLGVVLVAVGSACSEEETPADQHFEFTFKPAQPVAGEPIEFEFDARNVGLVELFQGSELLSVVANPQRFTNTPIGFYRFTAKSSDVPRAVAYAGYGAILRVSGRAVGGGLSPVPTDAGTPDAPLSESCPGLEDLSFAEDAGFPCGTVSTGFIRLRIENRRTYPVDAYHTPQPPQDTCAYAALVRVFPGATEQVTVFGGNIVRLFDGDKNQELRRFRLTQAGGACDLVMR